MGVTRCEVLVVGGGPAGSLVSLLLARRGVEVIQVVAARPEFERPHEILEPSTRRLLARHGLPEPPSGSADCRGALSLWSRTEPEFHDYALTSCAPALAVNRQVFHDTLLHEARMAGVTVHAGGTGDQTRILAERIVDASGRAGAPFAAPHVERKYFDRLLAVWTSFEVRMHRDCLLVEAAPEGWWYVPPAVDGRTQLVFLTDSDLLPRGVEARREWLSQRFRATRLISELAGSVPSFADVRGTDARFSCLREVVQGGWIALGDRALALDPLSGTGTWLALTGAERVAALLGDCGADSAKYVDWWRECIARERATREAVYGRAAGRFPNAPFWQRRAANAGALIPGDEVLLGEAVGAVLDGA